ncbi:MAG: peptidylprolyl isomerase, partial [Bacteroidales bacterium]
MKNISLMKQLAFLLVFLNWIIIDLPAQDDDDRILMTISDREITAGEFERIYKKNNAGGKVLDVKSVEEYLELFINFKLKVIEAENLGLDTIPSFKKELLGYRGQLAKPYLTDNETTERLIREAYERTETEVSASHILIKLPANPSPEDTLKAYNRALKIIDRLNMGESFEAIAKGASDDPSAKTNSGNLGYFTAFRMIYPFESAAYNTPVGEISDPLRTQFGYHIIKVNDKRSSRGEVKVAHIMIATPRGSGDEFIKNAKDTIEKIHRNLLQGAEFSTIAASYSDDRGTARNGGELPWFGTGRMVPEFEQAAFSLNEPGDISEPVRTSFGWHILKLIDKKPLGSFEEMKPDIKNKIARDTRSSLGKRSFVDKLKTGYDFRVNNERLAEFYSTLNPAFLSNYSEMGTAGSLTGRLFSFADKTYTRQDFIGFIRKNPGKVRTNDIHEYIDLMFMEFTDQELISYEDGRLEEKYPEFRYLLQEYHDGILLFELTDKIVWSKAVKDSAGLTEFYEKNKNKYLWDDRMDATIYRLADNSQLKEFRKILKKINSRGYSNEELTDMFNSGREDPYLTIESGQF